MDTLSSYETSANFYQTTRGYIPEAENFTAVCEPIM
jgi:hypothetical protein